MSETASVLRAARKMVERPENWMKGGSIVRNGEPCICVQIAICRTAGSVHDAEKPAAVFMEANQITGSDLFGIWSWNDAPKRTHAEVLAAFDRAIELAEHETAFSKGKSQLPTE